MLRVRDRTRLNEGGVKDFVNRLSLGVCKCTQDSVSYDKKHRHPSGIMMDQQTHSSGTQRRNHHYAQIGTQAYANRLMNDTSRIYS